MTIPEAARRVAAAARRLGLEIDIRQFPQGTKTAAEAAGAIGCEVSAIVKSLVFVVDDQPVVALLPGDRRLDVAKLARAAGGAWARRATLEEARRSTGYAAGGTPPFGHHEAIPVFADSGLARHDRVWAAAGTPTTVFELSSNDLVRAAGATWGDLAEDR